MRKTIGALITMLVALAAVARAAEKPAGPAEPAIYMTGLTRIMTAPWPKNRTVNIVCHGHSVPAGYFKTPVVDTFHAYPHLLHRGLGERFTTAVINVIVTAIGGEQSESGAARFAKDVLSLRPDAITIDYALNDRMIGLERARAAWSSMIEQAQAGGIKVILMTPTPDTRSKLDDPADPLNQHAEQIRSLAARYRVGLVDRLAAFKAELKKGTRLEDLMSQINHPNARGHARVAAELLKWFPAPETVAK